MGCGCGARNRSAAKAAGGGATPKVYTVTLPGETVAREFLTSLEARRAIRRAGGGTVRVVAPKSS